MNKLPSTCYDPCVGEIQQDEGVPLRTLSSLEQQVVDVFVDGVRVLGLPRSVGEIYGLLFISREPLALDDLVIRLGMSKGSASQGLRTLKGLGAVQVLEVEGTRRNHYRASAELKRLVGGFIREQVRPHLESGQLKVGRLQEAIGEEEDPESREFYDERIAKLENWMRRGRMVLPVLQKILGQ
ncbi:MAG: GbsR/MarR family transcriptional regulator [Verrucomicrobiales bacterium]